MVIMGVDPASTKTGYAFLDCPSFTMLGAGLITNSKKSFVVRSLEIADGLVETAIEHSAKFIAIEVPDGTVHGRLQKEKNARGLSVYGFAVGVVFRAFMDIMDTHQWQVITLSPADWTRRKSKKLRQAEIAIMYPEYAENIGMDKGADVSDAIGIAIHGVNLQKQFDAQKQKIQEEATARSNRLRPRPN